MHDIWNPWHGCKKCSPGCQNCYMYFLDEMREVKTPSDTVHKTGSFKYPLSKYKATKEYKIQSGERIRVNMTSDTFIEEADPWRDEMWSIIKKRSDVIFWILTKRPERIADNLPDDWGEGYENVSLNITCENQDMFNKRWPIFKNIPAKHKGLCLAPLLSDINITPALRSRQIEEVQCGGENYNSPRPCDIQWVKNISNQCEQFKINFNWYETGTRLIINNQTIFTPQKQQQSTNAYLSELNHKFYEIKFVLKDQSGQILTDDQLYKKQFNVNHCLFCSSQNFCNGCSDCKNCCCEVKRVDENEFKQLQAKIEIDVQNQ